MLGNCWNFLIITVEHSILPDPRCVRTVIAVGPARVLVVIVIVIVIVTVIVVVVVGSGLLRIADALS